MRACNQCGKCCIQYADGGLSATPEEISWWERQRPDIAAYVRDGQIWVAPDTGEQLQFCPWLKQDESGLYVCDIYFDRPEDCRHYPTHIDEMVRDGCEMVEPDDLKDPRQAQQRLDIIMSDSRPPAQ